jgi:membrane-bound serine protease (ClpP class)
MGRSHSIADRLRGCDDGCVRIIRRLVPLAAVALAIATFLAAPTAAQDQGLRGAIVQIPLEGVVDPFVADHITGQIDRAETEDATAVLLTIDTPGGLDSSMREITQAILNADLPVIAYVFPAGARAASAGTFILLSAHVAAMAPGTNVGAAHPVGLSGAVASEKATNDAAAYIRSLAETHDRNADWAERAVRESVSASAQAALDLGVIDLIANDIPSLLREVDGTDVTLADGSTVTLQTTGAPIVVEDLSGFQRFLHALLTPELAFVFFWLGLAFLVTELFVPGGVVGTIGALMLVASIVALGMLPVQLIGVVLLLASIVFFVLELKHPGIGALAVGGVVCLLAGGWLLFEDYARVSPYLVVPVAAGAAAFFLIVVRAAIRMRRSNVEMRDDTLVGKEGIVVYDLVPTGVIQIASEEWTAEAVEGTPIRGDHVRVVEVDGLTLKVEPVGAAAPAVPGSGEGRQG